MQKTKTSDSMSALDDFESNELENEDMDFDTAWSRFMNEQQHQQPQTPVPRDPVYPAPEPASTNLLNPQESSAFSRFLDTLLLESSTSRSARRVDEEFQKLSSLVETQSGNRSSIISDGDLNGAQTKPETNSRGMSRATVERSNGLGHKVLDSIQPPHYPRTRHSRAYSQASGAHNSDSRYEAVSISSESSGRQRSSESPLVSSRGNFHCSGSLSGPASSHKSIQSDSHSLSSEQAQQLQHLQPRHGQKHDSPHRSGNLHSDVPNQPNPPQSQLQTQLQAQVQTQFQAQQLLQRPHSHIRGQNLSNKSRNQRAPHSTHDTAFQHLVAASAQYVGYQQYHPFSSQYIPGHQLAESPGTQGNPQVQSQLVSHYSQVPLQYSSNSLYGNYGQYPLYYDPQGRQQENAFYGQEPRPLVGSKRKQGSKSDNSQMRINHVNSEKRRRAVIKDLFDKMCDMVPAVKNAREGLAKSSVLQFTHNHILSLYEANARIRKRLEENGVSCDGIPQTPLDVGSEPGSVAAVTNS